MRHLRPVGPTRYLSLGAISVAALTLGIILSMLSGCASTTASPGGSTSGDPSATAAAEASTATAVARDSYPTPTPAPADPASLEQAGCPSLALPDGEPRYQTVGGLRVSVPQFYTPQKYPDEMMPSNEPAAPYQVPLTPDVAQNPMAFHPNPPVNPSLSTGYIIQVCNQTSASHTISALSVNIASFTASSGPVAVWHLCGDGPYDAANKQTTPGCGGAAGMVAMLAATLPNDATGASAQATGNVKFDGPNLPITLPANQSITLLVAVNGLTAQGTYMLSFGMCVDGAAAATMAPSDGSFFIAPTATIWTGTACLSAAMQAKIPTTTKDTYYVCPPGA